MSIESQLYGRYSAAADKAQTLDQLKAIQDDIYKATQSGILHPVEGVPLVQGLTSRIQKAEQAQQQALMMQYAPQAQGMVPQGIAQGQPAPAPIAPQIMAQAQQLSGVDNLRTNLPAEEGYAAGGIIAFANGGDAEEDDSYTEDDREEANLMSLMDMARARIRSGIAAVPRAYEAVKEAVPRAYEAVKAAAPQSYERTLAEQPATARTTTTVEGGLSGMLNKAAAKHNLPVELLHRIAGSESGGSATAANPRSSAKGIFQFTDATWRGMGGKEGEQFNPETNTDLGAKFVRQNAEGLKNALGRNPTYGEVYASHFFGLQGAKDLMGMNPKTPMNQAVSPQVIKANPNLRGKTVGEVLGGLKSKMGEGIVSLAQGGVIKHFQSGGSTMGGFEDFYIDTVTPSRPEIDEYTIDPMTGEKLFSGYRGKKVSSPKASIPTAVAPSSYVSDEDSGPYINGQPPTPLIPQQGIPGTLQAQQAGQPEVLDPYLQKYMEMLQGRETQSAKQRETDKYLALLQAGLGMMGGTSPYAMVNIGQGATQGVGALMAANKQRAAEDAATLSGYGKLYTAKQAADLKRELTTANIDEKARQFDTEQYRRKGVQIEAIRKNVTNEILKRHGLGLEALNDPATATRIQAEVEQELMRNGVFPKLYREYTGTDFFAAPLGKPASSIYTEYTVLKQKPKE